MTNEVVDDTIVAKDKTEADWAMLYSEESRRRVKAERRLYALMYATGGLIKASQDALEAVVKPVEEMTEEMSKHVLSELCSLVMEVFDSEVMINLNTYDPVYGISTRHQQALLTVGEGQSATDQRLCNETFKAQRERLEESYEQAVKEWDLITAETVLNSREEVRKQRQHEFTIKLFVKDMADKALAKRLKEFEDGQEKQNSTTH